MSDQGKDPTRREFLLDLAKKSGYLAPIVMSFAVAPELLAAQGMSGSPPGKGGMNVMGMGTAAPTQAEPGTQPGTRPSEKHPPPSQKG